MYTAMRTLSPTKTEKQLKALFKELGELDTKRRNVLREIKRHPEYCEKLIIDTIESLRINNRWFITNTESGDPLPLERRNSIFRFFDSSATVTRVNSSDVSLYTVVMYTENLRGAVLPRTIQVSVDRPLIPQLTASCTEISQSQLAQLQKEIEYLEKEKERLQKISELEAAMKEMQEQLKKLKG